MNAPQSQLRPTVNIVGFGACIITGYPVDENAGFLRMAIAQAQPEIDAEIKYRIATITACQAPMAAEKLEENVFSDHPDIVVLQFGQSDAKIAVRRAWHEMLGHERKRSKAPILVANRPPNLANRLDSFWRGFAGIILSAQPVTSRSAYRESIAKMVDAIVSIGAYPIVFTPFVFDNFLSDAWARCYSCDLTDDFAGRTDVCVIDGWKLLAPYPRHQMLLHDGLHLTQWGHEILAQHLKPKLVERIQACVTKSRTVTPTCAHSLG